MLLSVACDLKMVIRLGLLAHLNCGWELGNGSYGHCTFIIVFLFGTD